jgi:putative ABC transport system substrate-binding protein
MPLRRPVLSVVLALALLAAALAAGAQPSAAKVWRVGILSNAPLTAFGMSAGAGALRSGLRELGYVEGQNVVLEFRWAESASDRLVEFATELVRLKVDAIVAIGPPAIQAAKHATGVVPIVMAISGDPVGLGFVGGLAHPGGNVTGVSFLGDELSGKLLELLKQAVPRMSRVAVLWNSTSAAHAGYLRDVQAAARSLGVTLQSLDIREADAFEGAFGRASREHADALLLLLDPLFTAHLRLIADFAMKSRLPAIYGLRQLVDAGGLMAYGPSLVAVNRRVALYVDKILKGAKPGDLPVEQPTKFELAINLKTAKALGLTVPPAVLARADEVIE